MVVWEKRLCFEGFLVGFDFGMTRKYSSHCYHGVRPACQAQRLDCSRRYRCLHLPAAESGVAANPPALPSTLLTPIDHSLFVQYSYTAVMRRLLIAASFSRLSVHLQLESIMLWKVAMLRIQGRRMSQLRRYLPATRGSRRLISASLRCLSSDFSHDNNDHCRHHA